MIGGHLLRGKHYQAGCLGGHLPVAYDGRRCNCGNLGCAEAQASGWALLEICKAGPITSGVLCRARNPLTSRRSFAWPRKVILFPRKSLTTA